MTLSSIFSSINSATKKFFGFGGRPVVIGGVTAAAMGPGLQKAGMLIRSNPVVVPVWGIVAGAVVLTVAIEGAFYKWGSNDGTVQAKALMGSLNSVQGNLDRPGYEADALAAMQKAGLDVNSASALIASMKFAAAEAKAAAPVAAAPVAPVAVAAAPVAPVAVAAAPVAPVAVAPVVEAPVVEAPAAAAAAK